MAGFVFSTFTFAGEFQTNIYQNPQTNTNIKPNSTQKQTVSTSIPNCQALMLSAAWFAAIAAPLSGLLFLFRILIFLLNLSQRCALL